MKTTHRNFSNEAGDFHRLCTFFIENYPQVRQHSTWCLGRMVDWKYGLWGIKPNTPGFWDKNAHLWFDAFGKLIGFVISEYGDEGTTLITTAGHRFLYEEMLHWMMENWGTRGQGLAVEIKAAQAMEIAVLAANGFKKEWTFFTSQFDLTQPLPERIPLEEGFTITSMKSEADYREQRRLRNNAFDGDKEISEAEFERTLTLYGYNREGPIYHADTDLCVVAPDGTFVSGCEALIDPYSLEVDIERVCTHSAYRRRGFARVVIQECLERLQKMEMKSAYITGYSESAVALYSSLGAVKRTESYIYKQSPS